MAIVAVFAGLVTWIFKPETAVPMMVVFPAFIIIFSVVATLFRTAQNLQCKLDAAVPALPRVLTALDDYGDGTGKSVLLLEASPFFGSQTPVSIYQLNHGGFEVMIGVGIVATVQANGLLPVRVEQWADRATPLLAAAIRNEADALRQIAVRPSVPINSPFSAPGLRDEHNN